MTESATDYALFDDEGEADDWPPEEVEALMVQVWADFRAGQFADDIERKFQKHRTSKGHIRRVLASPMTLIVGYTFQGSERIGFWDPESKYFVAYRPGRYAEFKTCFYKQFGLEYLLRLDDVYPIRTFQEGEQDVP